MDGFGIQVSIKTADDTLINVRGDDPTEFDMHLQHVVDALPAIRAAEAAVKGDGAKLLQEKLGAQVIAEYDTPQQPQAGYQQTHCDRCKQVPTCPTCGQLCDVKPMSLKNGAYFKHPCKSCGREGKTFWCNEPK